MSSDCDQLDSSLQWFLFLLSKCLSALRQYRTLNCIFVGGPPIYLSIDTENVVVWPPAIQYTIEFLGLVRFYGNSSFTIFIYTGFACVLEYTRVTTIFIHLF